MKPIIGLSAYYVKAHEFDNGRKRGLRDQDMLMSTMDYSESIVTAGGVPMIIAPIDSDEYLKNIVNNIDGLLLTGGSDVNPLLYNQPSLKGIGRLAPERDSIESKLIKLALNKGIPILGICRGFQLLNVHFGGTLIQDINNSNITNIQHVGIKSAKSSISHKIIFEKECKLKECFNNNDAKVNSFHHQVIDKLADKLSTCALSEDGFIEAFEYNDNSNVFAVQWHPEMMSKVDENQLAIFKLFVKNVDNFCKNAE